MPNQSLWLLLLAIYSPLFPCVSSFAPLHDIHRHRLPQVVVARSDYLSTPSPSSLLAAIPDLEVVALVAGQENYGLAVVCVGEAIWSFLQAPSLPQVRILIPAGVAALVLGLIAGPLITSSDDVSSVATGLWIATATSVGLGASYVLRLLSPVSPTPKEAAALGLIVAFAGFFSFSQNLIVDGFVTLPSLPSIPLPSFPKNVWDE